MHVFLKIIRSHHLLLGVLEALCDIVDWLMLRDRVLLYPGLHRLKRAQLRLTYGTRRVSSGIPYNEIPQD